MGALVQGCPLVTLSMVQKERKVLKHNLPSGVHRG